jgi:protein phosphatase
MNERNWIVLAAGVVCVCVAYFLGRRKRFDADRQEMEEEGAVASAAPSPLAAKVAASPAVPSAKESAKGTATSANGSAASAKAAPHRLAYDEDEEVDPTRVGDPSALKKRVVYQPPLKRIVYDEDAQQDEPTRSQKLFLVHAKAQTDVGLRRKRNEDSLLVLEREHLFVVADGMGGYRGGEQASQIAVKTIGTAYETASFEGPPHEGVAPEATNLARAIQMANAGILEEANLKPDLKGMGTTVCVARFAPNKNRLYIGHVGDSRCYRLRSNVLEQLTADHTMAEEGVTGPEGAKLSRAVGVWPTVAIDVAVLAPMPGDDYLLCSDGLTKMVPDEKITEILCGAREPSAAVDRLIAFANASGGKDNISVILIRVVPPVSQA